MGYFNQGNSSKINQLSSSLADIANHTPNTESVIFYNADPTKTNDSTQAFISAMQNYEVVIVPTGNYKFNSPITIQPSYKVQKIIGMGKSNSILWFTTDGIVNYKSGVIIEGICIAGNVTGSGFKLYQTLDVNNCKVTNFDIGIDLSQQANVITAFFEKTTVSYNKSYGIKVVSGGNYQNNGITFKELYIVKNGTDADTMTSNATTTNGHGMYINGGYAILVQDCIFEYNTGVGLWLTGNGYPLYGVTISCPYFERNKYGQLYVDNSYSANGYINNLAINGDFYSDAGLTPVANALSNRTLYVVSPDSLLNSFNGNYWGANSFADRNISLRKYNFLNAFPINRMTDLAIDYPTNIVNYGGENCFTITSSINGATFGNELISIDKNFDYIVSYDIKKVGATISPNMLFYLYDNDTNTLIYNGTANLNQGAFDWKTISLTMSGLKTNNTKTLRLYMNIEGTKPSDCEIYVKNIRIIPILKSKPGTVGTNVTVASSASSLAVSFLNTEVDISYVPEVALGWNSTYWITNKSTSGFTINFGTPPASTNTLDWSIKR